MKQFLIKEYFLSIMLNIMLCLVTVLECHPLTRPESDFLIYHSNIWSSGSRKGVQSKGQKLFRKNLPIFVANYGEYKKLSGHREARKQRSTSYEQEFSSEELFSAESIESYDSDELQYYERPHSLTRLNQKHLTHDEDSHYWRPRRSLSEEELKQFFNKTEPILSTSSKRDFPLVPMMKMIYPMVGVVHPNQGFHRKRTSSDSSEEETNQCLCDQFKDKTETWICSHYSSGEMGAILFSELCEADKNNLRTTPQGTFENAMQKCCLSRHRPQNNCPPGSEDRNHLILAMYLLTL